MAQTKKAIVLGCGLVGSTIARELHRSRCCEVSAADISDRNLERLASDGVRACKADLGQPEQIAKLVRNYDIVLGALPSRLGFEALDAVIDAGKPYCDISFMAEDPMALDSVAKDRGAIAIVDCGVSPGLSNLFVGYADSKLDSTECAEVYVGGLPKIRRWPYNYKAPFAPSDVVEEYTRPARLIENGRLVVKPALSEVELMDLPHVGTLEAFNTDGLRSLLTTVKAAHMKEKTLRYPGHAELMRVLRETGFFNESPLQVGDFAVRPIDVTSNLLFPRWSYSEKEEEFTVLRVLVEGRKGSRRLRYTFDLFDEYDRQRGESSMARTTAFPCVIAAKMIIDGRWTAPGVHPPELLARKPGVFEYFLDELKQRGVQVSWSMDEIRD